MSKYTPIKNHYLVLRWQEIFWTLIIMEAAYCSCLFVKCRDVVSGILKSEKSSCGAAKWLFIWVYSDKGVWKISCRMSGSQMVFIWVYFDTRGRKISSHMSNSQMVFNLGVFWHVQSDVLVLQICCHTSSSQAVFHISIFWLEFVKISCLMTSSQMVFDPSVFWYASAENFLSHE